jgi:hypothetical protein
MRTRLGTSALPAPPSGCRVSNQTAEQPHKPSFIDQHPTKLKKIPPSSMCATVVIPARVPHPGGYRVPELTEGDLNRPADMKGMIQVDRV